MLYTFDVDLAVIYTIHVYICRIYLGRGALESVFLRWKSFPWAMLGRERVKRAVSDPKCQNCRIDL